MLTVRYKNQHNIPATLQKPVQETWDELLGLQCSFGDKLDNVFLPASSRKCRVNGQLSFFQR